MSLSLRILPLAEEDIYQARSWYERQLPGLGDELLNAMEQCFERLAQSPLEFPAVHGEVRRALLRRFPYCIYFVPMDTEAVVLAVLHGRKNPQVLHRRM
jgi:plasmid stabilization system protein ParE